ESARFEMTSAATSTGIDVVYAGGPERPAPQISVGRPFQGRRELWNEGERRAADDRAAPAEDRRVVRNHARADADVIIAIGFEPRRPADGKLVERREPLAYGGFAFSGDRLLLPAVHRPGERVPARQ